MADTMDKSGEEHLGQTYDGEVGRYKILKIIGAGGMGVVCLGETEGTGRQVAVKFLHRELANESDSSRERFEREIKVLRDLKAFRGVVQIEDVGHAADGSMFLVMEYITGRPLNEIIEENPKGLPQMKAVQMIIEILIVLEPIHRTKKFIHRDLKPHNICVYEDPLNVRLLDFGLSKPFQEGSGYERVTRKKGGKAGEIPGSPHYMPEEQFLRPKEVDRRTDLYAVGIILYEILAGVPPFRGIYLQEILKQHRDKEAPPIETTADGGPLSYRLWTVIEKALAKSPASRYQTATEFREALEDVLKYLIKREQPKKAIDNRYRIIKKIGEGGNSEVFEAEDLVDNRQVALKIVKEGSSDWDEETLVNEADRALNHDNIVKIHDFGLFEKRPALVMDYVGGGTVAELVTDYGEDGLPEAVFYRVAIDVCKGLHHAHQDNIVHRDVKPENMLRTLDGRIKMADFGIAKRFEATDTGDVGSRNTVMAKGTAPYMSPEQCDLEGRVDRRADVYSLGCVLYEMLGGQPPFTEGILLLQHLQNDPPPLKVKGDFKNPDELCRIVERCLKKRKDERYQSMKELAQDLVRVSKLKQQKKTHKAIVIDTGADALTASEGGVSRESTQTNRLDATASGRPGWMNVAMIAAAVIAIGGVAAFMLKGDEKSPVDPNPVSVAGAGIGEPDPELRAAQDLSAEIAGFVDSGDWKAIAGLDLSAFAPAVGKDSKRRSVQNLERPGSRNFDATFDAPAKLVAFGEKVRAWGAAVAKLDEGSVLPAKAKKLADLAARAEATIVKKDNGLESFDESWLGEIQSARSELQTELQLAAFRFSDFATLQRNRARDDNLVALQARLEQGGEALDADESQALREVVKSVRRTKGDRALKPLFDAVEKHAASRLTVLEAPADLITWARGEGAELANLNAADDVSVIDFLRNARADIAAPNPPLVTRSGAAVARAIARYVEGKTFREKLAESFDANDPATWPATLTSLSAAGIAPTNFQSELCAVVDSLATSELAAATEQAYRQKPEAADALAKGLRKLRRDLNGLSPEASKRLLALAPVVETSDDARAAAFAERIQAIVSSPALDVEATTELLGELAEVMDYSSGKRLAYPTANYQKFARDMLDRDDVTKRPLTGCAFVEAAKGLIDPSRVDDLQQDLARDFVASIIRPENVVEAVFNSDPQARANAEWAQSKEPLIGVTFRVPQGDRALWDTGRFVLTTADGSPVTSSRDGDAIVFRTSPRRGFVQGAGMRVAVKVALVLRRGDVALGTSEATIAPKMAPFFDLEGPKFADRTPALRGEAIVVKLSDDRELANALPTVRVGGTELKGTRTGEGEFRFALGKELLKSNLKSTEKVVVTAVDGFGNSSTNRDLTFLQLRQTVARAEESRLLDTIRTRLAAVSVASQGSDVTALNAAISELQPQIVAMQKLDRGAAQKATNQLLSTLNTKLQAWIGAQPRGKTLADRRAAFRSVVEKGAGLAGTFGTNWTARASLNSQFENQARDLVAGGGGNTGTSGNSGNSGSTGNTGNSGSGRRVTDPPRRPTPTRAKYNDVVLTAGGVRFVPVKVSRKQNWLAEVEMSVAFAEANAGSVAKGLSKKTRGALPLAPLRARNAKAIVDALNNKFKGDLSAKGSIGSRAGGAVRFAVPSKRLWSEAAKKNNGGRYAVDGLEGNDVPAEIRWKNKPTGKIDRQRAYYGALRSVQSTYGAVFKGMAGNVSEIVIYLRSSPQTMGGHIRDVDQNNKSKLTRTQSNTIDDLTGLRLAIVPAK